MATRSIWKGPFINNTFFQEISLSNKNTLKTTTRNTVILPFLIGKSILVHNGKFFIPVYILEEMVGHKLGEFVPTRLRHVYKPKKKKNNGTKIKSK